MKLNEAVQIIETALGPKGKVLITAAASQLALSIRCKIPGSWWGCPFTAQLVALFNWGFPRFFAFNAYADFHRWRTGTLAGFFRCCSLLWNARQVAQNA